YPYLIIYQRDINQMLTLNLRLDNGRHGTLFVLIDPSHVHSIVSYERQLIVDPINGDSDQSSQVDDICESNDEWSYQVLRSHYHHIHSSSHEDVHEYEMGELIV